MWVGADLHGLIYSWNHGKDLGWVLTHMDDEDITEGWSFPGKVQDVMACLDTGNFPEIFKEVVRLTPPASLVDYKLVWRGPIASWLQPGPQPRMVVLGDAAHCHLPTSGQGASQSIEDGAAIAACLDKAKGDVSLALRAFERIRFNRQHTIHMSSISNRDEYHKIEWTRDFVEAHPDALKIHSADWIIEHDARGNVDEHFDHVVEDIKSGKDGTIFELSVAATGNIKILRPGQSEHEIVDTTFDLNATDLQPIAAQKSTVVA